ncbi:caspase family protein [Actinokineospora auranticolor]|uniref:Caspase domain-containing protein n=1 Tax=Actinokineospora auranticolor TaxID=155976 RepID=A0A2S6GRF9_9PSEU|nr:caspase family protein [Actinokineospora auranticolor]PPK67845.1 caspase domain-containing protein [Actinokineospora auranticolor]
MTVLPHRAHSRVVLIGTSDFRHADRLPPLPAVHNNLADLERALCDPETGIVDRAQCTVLDTPDSVTSLMQRLRRPVGQAEDLLVVYYSGHGIRHEHRHELYLTVHDTDPAMLAGTAVPFEWLKEAIEDSPARTKLLILDCCYSGLAVGAMSAGEEVRDIRVAGTSVITSSPGNQISHSPPGDEYTAFSGELITLLRNGSNLPGVPLTVAELYRSLVAAMNRRDLPKPKFKSTDTSSDLLLRRVPEPRLPEPPSVKPEAAKPEAAGLVAEVPVAEVPSVAEVPPIVDAPAIPMPGVVKPLTRFPSLATPKPRVRSVAKKRAVPTESDGVPAQRSTEKVEDERPETVARPAASRLTPVLWVVFFMGFPVSLGGILSAITAEPPEGDPKDLLFGLVWLGASALIILLIRFRFAPRRAGRQVGHVEALRITLVEPVSRWPRYVIGPALGFSLLMAVVAPFADVTSTTPGSISGFATQCMMLLMFLMLSATFVAALRVRARA